MMPLKAFEIYTKSRRTQVLVLIISHYFFCLSVVNPNPTHIYGTALHQASSEFVCPPTVHRHHPPFLAICVVATFFAEKQ